MSRFLHTKYQSLIPYDTSEESESLSGFIRLNTNESPYPPSPKAIEYAHRASSGMNYYPDPDCSDLAGKLATLLNVRPNEIVFGNGSDEILSFIFTGLCGRGAAFPKVTYSFYKILAEFHGVNYITLPLRDFRIRPEDYVNLRGRTVFIANPNAPTGLALGLAELEGVITANPESLIVIDEAYIDFGGVSAVGLVHEYENVMVVRTFSKSRSLAGARLGWCVAGEMVARDLRTIKNAVAPYNVNAMTQGAALGALEDEEYTRRNIGEICRTREGVKGELREMGFEVLDSETNFLFARHESVSGGKIHEELKSAGIIIRHFSSLPEWNRITIGTPEQMNRFLGAVKNLVNRQA